MQLLDIEIKFFNLKHFFTSTLKKKAVFVPRGKWIQDSLPRAGRLGQGQLLGSNVLLCPVVSPLLSCFSLALDISCLYMGSVYVVYIKERMQQIWVKVVACGSLNTKYLWL